MNFIKFLGIALIFSLLAACQSAAPAAEPNAIQYVDPVTLHSRPTPEGSGLPGEVEINGKMMAFDQVIHGPLCNNHLSGTVYIASDIEIAKWEKTSNFLDGCDFTLEDGSVIYVAAHQNAAYYKGCLSCHAGSSKVNP